jgi:hypothetical protein
MSRMSLEDRLEYIRLQAPKEVRAIRESMANIYTHRQIVGRLSHSVQWQQAGVVIDRKPFRGSRAYESRLSSRLQL